MRQARDTFLRYLNDNLPDLKVHNIRKDTNYPAANSLQMNAVNVQFLTDYLKVAQSYVTATVDVVYDNELDAVDAATKVAKLLSASGYVDLTDYSDSGNPALLGSNLFWDASDIKFRPVYGDVYFRHSALIVLSYHLY